MGYQIEVISALVGWPGRTWAFWRCSLSLEETGVFWDGVMCFQIGAWRLISTGSVINQWMYFAECWFSIGAAMAN